jgi:hypothetical protein
MIETGAYGERMARYLHLVKPPLYVSLGSGMSQIAVTRLHAPNGFSDQTSPIPVEKAFSIHRTCARIGADVCGSPADWCPPGAALREE